MSVQMNTYVMWGVLLPFSEFKNRDDFEDYHDSAFEGKHHHNGLCILSTGAAYEGCEERSTSDGDQIGLDLSTLVAVVEMGR